MSEDNNKILDLSDSTIRAYKKKDGRIYPYPLSRQKTEEFKMDSPPIVTAVGT
jgi:hypothetical protein